MICELLFYYGKNVDKNHLLKYLEDKPKPNQIITNNTILNEFLRKNGEDSQVLDETLPAKGPIADRIYENAKKLLVKYEEIFQNITYKEVKIFDGFSYPFLRQLMLLEKTRVILENKKNSIFVFEGYFDVYKAILKSSEELGYKNDLDLKLIRGNKIENLNHTETQQFDYGKKFSRIRIANFVKNSFQESREIKLKAFFGLIFQSLSFGTKIFLQKISGTKKEDSISKIQNKLSNNIHQTKNEISPKYAFFITGSREDLFFKPLRSILKKFDEEKITYKIFTSDLATSLVLKKQKIPFINLFEQVNLISELIKNTKEGQDIQNKINQTIKKNDSTLGIKEFSSYFFRQINRAVAITLLCDSIFKKMKLEGIFAVADGEMFENIAIALAKKYDILSITVMPGVFNPLPIFSDWFHSDKICVPGIKDSESMTNLGYDNERVIVTGSPKYDFLKKLNQKKSKLQLKQKYQINESRKLLVIARAQWETRDEQWISQLIKFCNKHEIEVIIKIHPLYKTKAHDVSENKIKEIKKLCKNLRYVITYDEDLYLLLSAADLIIIHESSTVGIEGCLSEKPMIIVDFQKNMLDFELRFHEIGAAVYIDTYNELEKNIIEILTKEKFSQELRVGREKVANQYNYRNDGKASQRIFQIITSKKEKK